MRLPDRVASVAIVSGMVDLTHPDLAALPPRPNLLVLRMGAERPCASRLVYRVMATTAKLLPGPMLRQASASMPEADPADVRVPVRMWHGDADENVPIEMARHLAVRVPGAELTVSAGEGHLSLVHRQLGTVLAGL